jgi:hypothetical protein
MTDLLPLLLLLFVVVGAGLVGYGFRQLRSTRGVRRSGMVTDAEVVEVRYLRPRTTATPQSGLFHPVVRFRTAAGRTVTTQTLVGANPAPAKAGDRLAVRYDPADPRRVDLATGAATSAAFGWLFVALGVGMAAGALLLLAGVLALARLLP